VAATWQQRGSNVAATWQQRGSNAALEKAIREKSARNNGDENLHIIEVGRVSVGGVEFVKVISETCGRRVFTHLSLTRVDQGSELSMMGGTYNSRSSSEFKLIKAALYSFHLQSK
jgi:hypothetical protein